MTNRTENQNNRCNHKAKPCVDGHFVLQARRHQKTGEDAAHKCRKAEDLPWSRNRCRHPISTWEVHDQGDGPIDGIPCCIEEPRTIDSEKHECETNHAYAEGYMKHFLAKRQAFIAMQGFWSVLWSDEELIIVIDRHLPVVIVATHAGGL